MSENTVIPNSYQTPNWIIDELMQWLEPNEWVVLSFMLRHILGWRDKIDDRKNRISLSQFEHGIGDKFGGCGLTRPQINRTLTALVSFNIISKVGEATKQGQEWLLIEKPSVKWEDLKARRERKVARGHKRVKKAATASAEKRKNDTTSTPSVPVDQYGTRTSIGTPSVPVTSTPSVHTKPIVKPNPKDNNNSAPVASSEPVSAPLPIQETTAKRRSRLDDTDMATVSTAYENEIGMITSMVADTLSEALDTYPAAWIVEAIKLAVENNARRWRYIKAILENWRIEGKADRKPKTTTPAATVITISPEDLAAASAEMLSRPVLVAGGVQ